MCGLYSRILHIAESSIWLTELVLFFLMRNLRHNITTLHLLWRNLWAIMNYSVFKFWIKISQFFIQKPRFNQLKEGHGSKHYTERFTFDHKFTLILFSF